jgi:hypothetical protein
MKTNLFTMLAARSFRGALCINALQLYNNFVSIDLNFITFPLHQMFNGGETFRIVFIASLNVSVVTTVKGGGIHG